MPFRPRSSRGELGFASITTNVSQTAGGNQDVSGLSVTVTTVGRPIKITFNAQNLTNSTANGVGTVGIKEDTTVLAEAALSNVSVASLTVPAAHREVRLVPSAGSHTYKINLSSIVGTTVLNATATNPAFIQVVEL